MRPVLGPIQPLVGSVWAVYRRLAAVDRFGKAIGNPVLISEGFQAVGKPGGGNQADLGPIWSKFLCWQTKGFVFVNIWTKTTQFLPIVQQ